MAQVRAGTTRSSVSTTEKDNRTAKAAAATSAQTTRKVTATADARAATKTKAATPRKATATAGPKAGNKAERTDAARQAKAVTTGTAASHAITPEMRQRMICETAYFLAAERGFGPGGEEQDWLRAEAEVDRLLGISGS
jgi:hypothetical protein